MIRSLGRQLLAGVVLALAGSLVQAQTLYGITGSGNNVEGLPNTPSSLYIVDPATGATTLVGSTGFFNVTAIDFDPTSGILYGVVSGNTSNGPLITINPATGAGTAVGVVGQQIPDITIGPDGVIRGWTEDSDDPVTINKLTGAITVTASSLSTSHTGVASAASGTIYVKPSARLYTVDTSTGVATLLWTFQNTMDNILENEPGGTLISGTRDGQGTQLYRLDPATGTQTALGHSPQLLSALAYAVPPPAPPQFVPALGPLSLVLLSLVIAFAGLGCRWRNALGR